MKRFRLDIVGKLEDHPRLLRAYGRVKGGEIALVLRPLDYTGLLVRIGKDGAQQWAPTGQDVPAAWPRVQALIQKRGRSSTAVVMGGPFNNQPFRLRGDASDGDIVCVALDTEKKSAVLAPSDAPKVPALDVAPADAVRAIKRLQVAPGKPGSVTFRGRWAGTLICDHGRPRVELRRKLASYGWLRIASGPHGWTWRFERQEKWFTEANQLVGEPLATLVQAIDAGVLGAMGQVQVACRVRDTRRRQGLDQAWAETHPVPEPRPTKNPTERLLEPGERPAPARRRASRKHSAPEPNAPKASQPKTTRKRPTAPAKTPASKTQRSPSKPPRTRKRRTPKPASSASAPPTTTAPQDAALLAAFSDAVAAALTD